MERDKGPVLCLVAQAARASSLRKTLAADRYEVQFVTTAQELLASAMSVVPTVILFDWSITDDSARLDLLYELHRQQPRRTGPRIVAIAEPPDLDEAMAARGVHAVLPAALDTEELVDVVWRLHHEVDELRAEHGSRSGQEKPAPAAALELDEGADDDF